MRCRASGHSASADHVDQPTWRLGIAANRLPYARIAAAVGCPFASMRTFTCGPKLKNRAAVSTKPYRAAISAAA